MITNLPMKDQSPRAFNHYYSCTTLYAERGAIFHPAIAKKSIDVNILIHLFVLVISKYQAWSCSKLFDTFMVSLDDSCLEINILRKQLKDIKILLSKTS